MMKRIALVLLFMLPACSGFAQQDWIRTGTGLGVEKVRLAVPDFKQVTADSASGLLLQAFNETLWNDLGQAGIFDVVSKSFYPLQVPGSPEEVKLDAWANPPTNASMLAFGNLNASTGDVAVQGWLYDV